MSVVLFLWTEGGGRGEKVWACLAGSNGISSRRYRSRLYLGVSEFPCLSFSLRVLRISVRLFFGRSLCACLSLCMFCMYVCMCVYMTVWLCINLSVSVCVYCSAFSFFFFYVFFSDRFFFFMCLLLYFFLRFSPLNDCFPFFFF